MESVSFPPTALGAVTAGILSFLNISPAEKIIEKYKNPELLIQISLFAESVPQSPKKQYQNKHFWIYFGGSYISGLNEVFFL